MYWVLFAVPIALCALFEFFLKTGKRAAWVFALIIYFLAFANNFYNGIDWMHYKSIFEQSFSIDAIPILLLRYEVLFVGLLHFISIFSHNYQLVVIVIALFNVISLYISINTWKKYNQRPINISMFVLLLFLMFGFSLQGEQLRQSLAFAIVLPYLINIRYISLTKVLVAVSIAALFHVSAIFLFLIVFILKAKPTRILIALVFLVSFIFAFIFNNLTYLIEYLIFLPDLMHRKLFTYVELSGEVKIGLFAYLDLLFIGILLYLYRFDVLRERVPDYVWFGALIFFLLHIVFYFFPPFQRLNYYLFPFVALYASHGMTLNIFNLRYVFFVLLILYSASSFYKQVFGPYYEADWYDPKFYLTNLTNQNNNSFIFNLKVKKCEIIHAYDPLFCPSNIRSIINLDK